MFVRGGDEVPSLCSVTVTCNEGYALGNDDREIYCIKGNWTSPLPACRSM